MARRQTQLEKDLQSLRKNQDTGTLYYGAMENMFQESVRKEYLGSGQDLQDMVLSNADIQLTPAQQQFYNAAAEVSALAQQQAEQARGKKDPESRKHSKRGHLRGVLAERRSGTKKPTADAKSTGMLALKDGKLTEEEKAAKKAEQKAKDDALVEELGDLSAPGKFASKHKKGGGGKGKGKG